MLTNIDNFLCRKDGNPFNATTAPLAPSTSPLKPPPPPPPASPAPPFWGPAERTPGRQADGPSATEESNSVKKKKILTTRQVVGISIAGFFLLIIMVLGVALLMPRFSRHREAERISKRRRIGAYEGDRLNPRGSGTLLLPTNEKG
jgi:hypothetical protein